ncbi:glycosyltransferase [Oerskovia paurometabola]|uniref:glycosyltransferase n=1 Tax=Oerskovia paurometabola TaxID=162170 RepID=UPI00342D2069
MTNDDTIVGPEQIVDLSVVVPVYRGAETIAQVIDELKPLVAGATTPEGRSFRLIEAILVWDHGPDDSPAVMQALAEEFPWIRNVWLSRNFGQHPATVAGLAASRGEWVVTMDEDGQHAPADIARMLDIAYDTASTLVYAAPTNDAPHSVVRNLGSRITKRGVLPALSGRKGVEFHSFRLIHGEHARGVAAYCGPGVYLDVALGWVISDVAACPVELRTEGREATSYSMRRLVSHLWRLVLSSGNRPLRIVSATGVIAALAGMVYAVFVVLQRVTGQVEVEGWASTTVVVLILGGLILIALGVVAEYVGMAAAMSMGKPLYVLSSDVTPRLRAAVRDKRGDG